MKREPITLTVTPGVPTVAVCGASEAMDGTGLFMATGTEVEEPPPGCGLTTRTCETPATGMSVAGTWAVSWLALTNVVVRVCPFHCTDEVETKFEPFTVSVKAGSPAVTVAGEIDVTVGAGLLTAKLTALDVEAPGF
jgi:hypothetical protein